MNSSYLTFVQQHVAATFAMPEILTARWVVDGSAKLTTAVQPTGQLALICQTVEATIGIAEAPDDQPFVQFTVAINYKHHGGGSNSKAARFVLLTTKDPFGDTERTPVSVVRYEDFALISDATYRQAEKNFTAPQG